MAGGSDLFSAELKAGTTYKVDVALTASSRQGDLPASGQLTALDENGLEFFSELLEATVLNPVVFTTFSFFNTTDTTVLFQLDGTLDKVDADSRVMAVTPVPLPAALPLFLAALLGIGFIGRQRRRKTA